MSQTLNLEAYLDKPVETDATAIRELDSKLEELANTSFGVEILAKQMLLFQKALYTYPELNTSFLSMNNRIKYKIKTGIIRFRDVEMELVVPKFGVYHIDNPRMIMEFYKEGGVGVYNLPPRNIIATSYRKWLPPIITEPLLKSVKDANGDLYELNRTAARKGGGPISLDSELNTLLPTETRERAKEAKKIFGDELYLISEVKPEEWTVRIMPKDPLVVGVLKGVCFYIHEFNATPLERYVKAEFLALPFLGLPLSP